MGTWIDSLLDRAPLAIMTLGFYSFASAVTANILLVGNPSAHIGEAGWRLALAVLGCVLIVSGLFLQFWKRMEAREQVDVASYGIRITYPADKGTAESSECTISGTYSRKPPVALRLFVVSASGQYWPQSDVQLHPNRGEWTGTVYLGGTPPVAQNIMVALVGKNGRVLCDYYDTVGVRLKEWPSIQVLTDDIIECDRIQVTRVK